MYVCIYILCMYVCFTYAYCVYVAVPVYILYVCIHVLYTCALCVHCADYIFMKHMPMCMAWVFMHGCIDVHIVCVRVRAWRVAPVDPAW